MPPPHIPRPPVPRPETASPQTLAVAAELRRIAALDPAPRQLVAALRLLAKWRSGLVAATLAQRSGTRVLSGPFQGMDYCVAATEGGRAPRLLGVYEAGLAPVIEAAVARSYPLVIDVGCAEGYYAVGMALRLRRARILARDLDPRAQERCRALAKANGVAARVEIGGAMGPGDFAICTAQPTLVICDIEGAEDQLLNPEAAPGLRAADILVECHDGMVPGLSDRIAARFAESHHVTRIGRVLNATALPGWTEELSDLDRLLALWEWRASPTPWLWLERRG